VSVHVAANILVKPDEVEEFIEYIGFLNAADVDAVIIQDIGMAKAVREVYPDLPIHGSTQMTAASLSAVRYLEEAGFSRVVLARELSEKEIRYICENTDVEIETFVHGAICMCYSGQCLMSSIIGARSGNRGMCAQPCRLPYKLLKDSKIVGEGYLLSPKDMALVNYMDRLESCGVASLKIEGRLKRPEYVSTVVGIYRKYIDNPKRVLPEDFEILKESFSRSGFTDGYFTGNIGGHMMSYDIPGNTASNLFSDEIIERSKPDSKIMTVDIKCKMCKDKKLYIKMEAGQYCVCAESDVCVQKALNKAIEKDRLKEQLVKLGDSIFRVGDVEIYMDSDAFIPIKEINATRRYAVELLEKEILKREKRRVCEFKKIDYCKNDEEIELTAQVFNKEQLRACERENIKIVYIPEKLIPEVKGENIKYVVILPEICDNDKRLDIPKDFGVLISNVGQEKIYEECEKYANSRLNVFNSYSLKCFEGYRGVTLSSELNLKEISKIGGRVKKEVVAYGKIPLMIMKNCPVKSITGKCGKNGGYTLRDRKNEEFIMVCDGYCHSVILNSKNIYMADKLADIKRSGIDRIRLNFYDESFEEALKTIKEYKKALNGEDIEKKPENSFTRGHFYRGVL